MKKWIFILLFLVFVTPLWALEIPKTDRVPNRNPGYCGWACMETLGRYYHIQGLYDLVENRSQMQDFCYLRSDGVWICKNHTTDDDFFNTLQQAKKVKLWMQRTGGTDRDLLKYADDYGCIISIKAGFLGPQAHAIILTHYDGKTIQYWDCNHPQYMWQAEIDWFNQAWTGLAIVISPEKE